MTSRCFPCDFNIAFYTVSSKMKYDNYNNTGKFCVWYKDNKKVAHYDKKEKCLWIYK